MTPAEERWLERIALSDPRGPATGIVKGLALGMLCWVGLALLLALALGAIGK